MKVYLLSLLVSLFTASSCLAQTDTSAETRPIRIGFVGSLTGFAANYGQEVLNGARLAVEEVGADKVELVVEDDASQPKQAAVAYRKLKSVNKIEALIGGTWWANSIVGMVSEDGIPFLSCETVYDKEFVLANNYFSLAGDLRDWIAVFEPLVKSQAWKKAAMVRFVSGFAETLNEELEAMFTRDGRRFLSAFQYTDFQMQEAQSYAARVKTLSPDVLYIDGQPASFAALMQKLIDLHTATVTVLSNQIAEDAYTQKLFDPASYKGKIFFSRREPFAPEFSTKYEAKFSKAPVLHADLGYSAVRLLAAALTSSPSNPVGALKSGTLTVEGKRIAFDEHNVYRGLRQEVFEFKEGTPVRAQP